MWECCLGILCRRQDQQLHCSKFAKRRASSSGTSKQKQLQRLYETHVKMQAWSRRRSQVRVLWRQLGTWYSAEQLSCSVSAPAPHSLQNVRPAFGNYGCQHSSAAVPASLHDTSDSSRLALRHPRLPQCLPQYRGMRSRTKLMSLSQSSSRHGRAQTRNASCLRSSQLLMQVLPELTCVDGAADLGAGAGRADDEHDAGCQGRARGVLVQHAPPHRLLRRPVRVRILPRLQSKGSWVW